MIQHILLIVAIFLSCAMGASAQWNFAGLGDKVVIRLQILDRTIYATTNDGIYQKNLDVSDTVWRTVGLQGQSINAFIALNKDTMIAAHKPFLEDTTAIYRTVNGGMDWVSIKSPSFLYTYYLDTNSQGALLATQSSDILMSKDVGTTWQPVWGDQTMFGTGTYFIAHDTHSSNILWSGGKSYLASPYLLKSTDHGNSWIDIPLVVGGDNGCYSAVVLPGQSDEVLTGMEGRIMKTSDGGQQWTTVYEASGYPYFYSMALSPIAPRTVYATGLRYTANAQPLVLYRSTDGGESWTAFEYNEELFNGFGPMDMKLDESNGKDIVYMGTPRGVYTFSGEATDVKAMHPLHTGISMAPLPAFGHITLTLSLEKPAYCTAGLFTTAGQEAARLFNGSCSSGTQTIQWDTSTLPDGLYFCVVHIGTQTKAIPVPIVK